MSQGESKEASEEQNEPSAVMERLNWQLASRDDGRVAQALYAGEEIEEMHELSEAGLLDEFFVFVEQVGMMAVLEQQDLPGVRRVLVPTVQFVLLYLLKVLFGGQSMNELPRVLFSHVALMELIGFNARQVEEGLTKRGDAGRKTKKKQGPLSPQCLADNISKSLAESRWKGSSTKWCGVWCNGDSWMENASRRWMGANCPRQRRMKAAGSSKRS